MLMEGLYAYLIGQSAVTAIIGESATAIRPIPAPEDLSQYPLITFQGASYKGDYGGDGYAGVSRQRIIFDCRAQSYLVARNLGLAVKTALDAMSNAVTVAALAENNYLLPDGTRVFDAEVGNLLDMWDDGSRVSCVKVHLIIQSNE